MANGDIRAHLAQCTEAKLALEKRFGVRQHVSVPTSSVGKTREPEKKSIEETLESGSGSSEQQQVQNDLNSTLSDSSENEISISSPKTLDQADKQTSDTGKLEFLMAAAKSAQKDWDALSIDCEIGLRNQTKYRLEYFNDLVENPWKVRKLLNISNKGFSTNDKLSSVA